MYAHAHADNLHVNGVIQCQPWKSPTIYQECPCTPPSIVETFGEEISAEACSGKEIAGLLRKMRMMMMMMTRNREIACERILACQTGGR